LIEILLGCVFVWWLACLEHVPGKLREPEKTSSHRELTRRECRGIPLASVETVSPMVFWWYSKALIKVKLAKDDQFDSY